MRQSGHFDQPAASTLPVNLADVSAEVAWGHNVNRHGRRVLCEFFLTQWFATREFEGDWKIKEKKNIFYLSKGSFANDSQEVKVSGLGTKTGVQTNYLLWNVSLYYLTII